jgi:hypothetical protein
MAAAQDCELALDRLAARLASADVAKREKHALTRSVSVHVDDLDRTWRARLDQGLLVDICPESDPADAASRRAQIRISGRSDDLIAMIDGSLSMSAAWASGRCKIEASPLDLLRLRALL